MRLGDVASLQKAIRPLKGLYFQFCLTGLGKFRVASQVQTEWVFGGIHLFKRLRELRKDQKHPEVAGAFLLGKTKSLRPEEALSCSEVLP